MDDSEIPDSIKIPDDFSEGDIEYTLIERHYIGKTVELDYSKCKKKAINVSGTLEKIAQNGLMISNNGTIYSKMILPAMIIKLKK